MTLWVRLGAFDAMSPEQATALAWAFEDKRLKAAVFPFATRFTWLCESAESFLSCADKGLRVFDAPPQDPREKTIRSRIKAGRAARASSNPDAQNTLRALLADLFANPHRLRPLGDDDNEPWLAQEELGELWARYFGVNNAILVVYGFEPGAQLVLEERVGGLREATSDFAVPEFALESNQFLEGKGSDGYEWFAASLRCFEALSALRRAALKLSPSHITYLIDIRGHGYLAILLGPPLKPDFRDFLRTMVQNTECEPRDPVMHWLIAKPGLDTTR